MISSPQKKDYHGKAARDAKALAEGRVPGKQGPKPLSDEERIANRKATHAKYRQNNLEKIRLRDAQIQRDKRADRAIAEGRTPGIYGAPRHLTDAERKENSRKSNLRYWARMTPEEKSEYCHESYLRNIDAKVAYQEAHVDECRENSRNYRAKKRGNGGTHTKEDVKKLKVLQKNNCTWCLQPLGDKKPHVDHNVPLSKGGSNDVKNLQLLHGKCNLKKHATHPTDFGLKHGLLAW